MPLLIFGFSEGFLVQVNRDLKRVTGEASIFVAFRGSSGLLSGSGSQREYSFVKNKVGDIS